MFILKKRNWHSTHTDLSKYFIMKFTQLVDKSEFLTNNHTSTNGLILLEELCEVSSICLKRSKNHRRLQSLLNECSDESINSSVVSDVIINKYFRPAANNIREWQRDFSIELIQQIYSGTLLHKSSIKPVYLTYVQKELNDIDFSSRHFDTYSKKIDELLSLLIPQLVYDGYSLAFLQIAPKKLIQRPLNSMIKHLFTFFDYSIDRKYRCFIPKTDNISRNPLIDILNPINITLRNSDYFPNEKPVPLDGYSFEISGKDPFSALRNRVTLAYRKYSLEYTDATPHLLDPFWEEAYYFNGKINKFTRYNFSKTNDPLIPSFRKNTLSHSLSKHEEFLEAVNLDNLSIFEEPIYFYNLARTVPSVENSYILLWTALEALMGLRSNKTDIEIIKDNVAQSIALGAVGRRLLSFHERYTKASEINKLKLLCPKIYKLEDKSLSSVMSWAIDKTFENKPNDPFNAIKTDPLLAKQYRIINEKWGTLQDLLDIINTSSNTISYQLDRLYFTRNMIVHAAQLGKTGDHLWVHLEWYIGKLLAQAVVIMDQFKGSALSRDSDPRDIVFGSLQGQYKASIDYLERHKDAKITRDHLINSGIFRFPMLCF
ncbi:hypothetical protein [Paenibacillus sp. JDR-2]|uniref:hypothetical protein n=1 Tax=Paenibacillus sp. (strain JDR-2) TaxID=324057 RepID=UPI000166AF40|nr:hypothetical protein [Paenibacillus sp. JDR-2]ACS99186.1 hypothetical protein Pjdr2_0506 [Paenibacillus sp. JDR-2]